MGAEGGGDRRIAGEKVAANVGVGRHEGVNELEGGRLLLALVDLEPAEVGAVEAVADRRRQPGAQGEEGHVALDVEMLPPGWRSRFDCPHGALRTNAEEFPAGDSYFTGLVKLFDRNRE